MEFASKAYFLLLLLLIPYILWYFLGRKKSEPTMRMSDTTHLSSMLPRACECRLIHLPMVLRCICFVLIVIAMARPQTHYSWDNKTVEGIDIMLAMDVSTSMLAEDLKPNRMEAAKDVATEFISGRPDRQYRIDHLCRRGFHAMSDDHRSCQSAQTPADTRTDIAARGLIDDGTAVGMGLARRRNPTQGFQGKEQGGDPAYRR